ncbi:hypothetical protein I3760_02G026400 [Carya illinoinensis]|nr:hypothetical protein I3760_Q006000 [Carya illinoinensis]KAG2720209.1 hypothetical protein I3760_02G026400 [Carya illinoinensis]
MHKCSKITWTAETQAFGHAGIKQQENTCSRRKNTWTAKEDHSDHAGTLTHVQQEHNLQKLTRQLHTSSHASSSHEALNTNHMQLTQASDSTHSATHDRSNHHSTHSDHTKLQKAFGQQPCMGPKQTHHCNTATHTERILAERH